MTKNLFPVIVLIMLAGCATAPHSTYVSHSTSAGTMHHTVKAGETLWSVSKMYDADLNAMLKANSLQNTSVIKRGQVLIIPKRTRETGEKAYSSAGKNSFIWPVSGRIISPFGAKVGNVINKGIDIKAGEGAGVVASKAGKVVYCDSRLKGFGKTIIIDHGDRYQTVYSYNSDILVGVGDEIAQNTLIGKVGRTGRASESCLHFEIRKDGQPQNPAYYLPN